jgi:hypothetical protein
MNRIHLKEWSNMFFFDFHWAYLLNIVVVLQGSRGFFKMVRTIASCSMGFDVLR